MRIFFIWITYFLWKNKARLIILCCVAILSSCQSKDTLFQSVSASKSNINFVNGIVENDSTNILEYEYLYNGGGVAVADFNNDGLPDLYFVGNMVSNRMYLNRGNMQFSDITEEAGTGGNKQWYTGVSIVDINEDNKPDIYVCAARSERSSERKNVLFINKGIDKNGVPVFKNEAEEYGLATTVFSTQAVFFDYDNDGDLDMYEMVSGKRRNPRTMHSQRSRAAESKLANVDRLYRNDWKESLGHPFFSDVSAEAGINKEGYGLGIHVFDINRDGWKDIYVSNDYISNDLLWINNGDGTFTDRARDYFKHTSFSAMGTDAGDINNDGLTDLISLDMAGRNNLEKQTMTIPNNYRNYFEGNFTGFDPEFTRNTLQLNQGAIPGDSSPGHPIFSDVALLSGIAQTNWSWGVLMADFNNDGYKDIVITNGIPKNKIHKDFVKLRDQIGNVASRSMLSDAIPSDKSSNFIFQNNGELQFSDKTSEWGLKTPSYSSGLAWADFDNDGDLDLVMNNTNHRAFLYKNTLNDQPDKQKNCWLQIKFLGSSKNLQGLGVTADVYCASTHQTYEHTIYRGYLSSMQNMVHIGLGVHTIIDSLVVTWPPEDGITQTRQIWRDLRADQTIIAKASEAKEIRADDQATERKNVSVFTDVPQGRGINFVQKEMFYTDFKIQRMLPHQLSQYGPGMTVGDVNGDGLQDLFIGGSFNVKGSFLVQQADGSFREEDLLPGPEGKHKMQEDEGVLLFDADGDGDQDLYIVSGSVENKPNSKNYQDRMYKNDGKGHFEKEAGALPDFHVSGSGVKATDYDHDGDLDLFVAGRSIPGFYPAPVSSHILSNDSNGGKIIFTDVTSSIAKSLLKTGLVTDALWSDYNNDGWPDLMISGEWMPLMILENQQGTFTDVTNRAGLAGQTGWWNSLTSGDFDNDGDMDYIAGNMGTNTIYKASSETPVGIYSYDFDQNGAYDAIPTLYLPDSAGVEREYPAHQLNDLTWQLPRIARQFQSNVAYAHATIHDILSKKQLQVAIKYHASNLRSSYLENRGDGTFDVKPLPVQAQFAPVFGMVADDFDGDGNLDVLLNGNDYGAEVQVGAYDALNGLLLKGDGKGGFISQRMDSSGIFIPGNGKALVKIAGAGGDYLIAASQNSGPLKLFKANEKLKIYPIEPADVSALIHYKNGEIRKEEFYYGSSFLSASGRFLLVSPGMKSAEIASYTGETRSVAF